LTSPRHAFLAAAACGAAVLLGTAACGGDTTSPGEKITVVGSFYPMAWVAERVAGSAASVTTLTKPGTEPHDLELTPRQVVSVGEADLVIYIRGVQPAVDDAVGQHAKDKAVDAASLVKTLPAAEEASGEEEDGAEHADGEHAEFDPHLWLDPNRLAAVATAVGDRLARADPGQANAYRTGARRLAADLTTLDREFAGGLRSCAQQTIVTSHAAFAYLADRYGLDQVSIAGIDPESEPSPRRLAELTGEIRRTGVTTVFTETLVSPKVAQTLAREAGARIATLDPVEGLPAGSTGDYLSVMRQNLQTLRTALACR
jgi:zinc transport system substrate-binding protein